MNLNKIFAAVILISTFSFSQVIHEPLYSDVYNYLHRLSQKGVIEFNDLFKPLSRKYILEKLIEAGEKTDQLTSLEKKELEFFKSDYFMELTSFSETTESGFFERDSIGRFRMFYYKGPYLKLNASPIIGLRMKFPEEKRATASWNGLKFSGYLPANIGYDFNFRITNEKGTGVDRFKTFTPVTGAIIYRDKHSINYSEVNTMLSVNWNWGNAVIGKGFLQYGHAKSGNLVLSTKAPSFPFISLHIHPADWLNFHWFHAFLSSNVLDSVNLSEYRRNIYRDKYFAWHSLVITPMEGLDISIGESIVYSDKLEFIYLMPVMFYFLADDFVNDLRNRPGDANVQFFLSVSSKNHIKNTHLYGTLLVDELTLRGIGGAIIPDNPEVLFDNNRYQVGFTTGLSVTDLPIDNLTTTVEYTKIFPFVYGHHTAAQTYTNSSYLMGHWIDHNADLLHIDLHYRIIRGLQVNLWGEYIRKGSSDYSKQYSRPQPSFLFGLKKYYKYFGVDVRYELIHELNAEIGFRTDLNRNEVTNNNFAEEEINNFYFSFYYGL